jgi:hypothetical protein
MFARKVAARLRPNSLSEFTDLMEREILPWLRKQEGFLDLIMLADPDGREVATISFWDHEGTLRRTTRAAIRKFLCCWQSSWTALPTLRRLTWSARRFEAPLSDGHLKPGIRSQKLVRCNAAIAPMSRASESELGCSTLATRIAAEDSRLGD